MLLAALLAAGLVLLACAAALVLGGRRLLDRLVDRLLVRLLSDRYDENLWDLVIGITRMGPHVLFETELRAETGRVLRRPLGSLVRVEVLSGLAFNPAQLVRLPAPPDAPVDLSTTLGPRAPRPLRVDFPVLVAGMAYGFGVHRQVALALARGAEQAGTAYNAGGGPLLEEVASANRRLVLQYAGGAWTRNPERLGRAQMVEIRLGHGGRAATGRILAAGEVPEEVRRALGGAAERGEPLRIEAPLPGTTTPRQLRRLVARLRGVTGGAPVAVKLAATHDLELEVLALLDAGVDVLVIDGSEGGTRASPPVLEDDFGLPTAHALARVTRLLEQVGARGEVSLVISGGLRTPGEVLKAIALGADAAYLGTAVLMAATHGQISKSVPVEPVTQIAWSDGRLADRFDAEKGARTVAAFLRAFREEMEEALRALGYRRIGQLSRADLVARDPLAAEVFGLPVAWRAPAGLPDGLPPTGGQGIAARERRHLSP
ncbi:MAG: FMN-binding glutamate synthase family protein [Clostridia bacterium]|nr:FMN-binding glutamate synthase family protein [Clostridia bacterium]